MITEQRSSGILMHITSLPSKYGIGDMGPEAYKFADKLQAAGQRYWQILPLTPTDPGYGNSPYSSHSAFAGNPLLISPELLVQDGLLTKKDLHTTIKFTDNRVDYTAVGEHRKQLWSQLCLNYNTCASQNLIRDFEEFKKQQTWLHDFALYIAIKNYFGNYSWTTWPDTIKHRDAIALQTIAIELTEAIDREKLLQFLFYRQWQALKSYCNQKDIYLIGDMPFYVSHDSADVWANQTYFKLDNEGQPTAVSGVPPDYFSATGQLWGTPVFNWKKLQQHNFDWWLERVGHNLILFDLLRLDHFRAFSAYWEVPAGEITAINGKWVKTPGTEFLEVVRQKYPHMPIIAEDLGEIDEPVRELQRAFTLPGMLILLFAFGEDMSQSIYAPHNHYRKALVYTGTHDNTTIKGWYEKTATPTDRKRLQQYCGQQLNKDNVHEAMCRMAYMSVAQLAIVPMQDVLGLGIEATMNKPSTTGNNWEWRLQAKQFTKAHIAQLRQWASTYGRL